MTRRDKGHEQPNVDHYSGGVSRSNPMLMWMDLALAIPIDAIWEKEWKMPIALLPYQRKG